MLAQGLGTGGERWTLTATPVRKRLQVMVEVVQPDGVRWVSGSGGPALPPGRRVATFVGRSGPSSHLVIVRVTADVRAVVATLSDGTREDLRLHGDADMLGARIAVLVFPPELELQRLVLMDADGVELAEEL